MWISNQHSCQCSYSYSTRWRNRRLLEVWEIKESVNVICLPTARNTKEFTKTRSEMSMHSQIELEFGTFIGIEIFNTS